MVSERKAGGVVPHQPDRGARAHRVSDEVHRPEVERVDERGGVRAEGRAARAALDIGGSAEGAGGRG